MTIENEQLQMQINYEQYKEVKIKLRKLLDERQIMATRLNEKDYKEMEIQEYFEAAEPSMNKASNASVEEITSMQEINLHLIDQIKMLQIGQEIQMVKM